MSRVIRDVDVAENDDLLAEPPRAALAFVSALGPEVLPVHFVREDARYVAGFAAETDPAPRPGDEVVLLVDAGIEFFDLRAVYIRGTAVSSSAPGAAPDGLDWIEVEPAITRAWDYGRMRRVPGEDG